MLVAWSAAGVIGHAQTNSGMQQPPQVEVEMRNIMYHFTGQVAVHIFSLQGKLVPAKQNGIPVFDDNRSFILAIRSAEIAISTNALANVLNQHVFASPDAPLKNIALSIDGNMLKITGRLHSKGDIPFEAEGTLSLTAQGEILIHTQKIKAAHLPVKGFMDLLGLEVSDLINTQKVRGVRAEKDDLVLSPEQILPPPQIQGRVTDVRLKGDEIVQTFGGEAEGKGLQQQSGNYMAYRGAQLRFGPAIPKLLPSSVCVSICVISTSCKIGSVASRNNPLTYSRHLTRLDSARACFRRRAFTISLRLQLFAPGQRVAPPAWGAWEQVFRPVS